MKSTEWEWLDGPLISPDYPLSYNASAYVSEDEMHEAIFENLTSLLEHAQEQTEWRDWTTTHSSRQGIEFCVTSCRALRLVEVWLPD